MSIYSIHPNKPIKYYLQLTDKRVYFPSYAEALYATLRYAKLGLLGLSVMREQ